MILTDNHSTERERRLEALLSASASPQALFDIGGRLLAVNRAFATILGLSPEDAEGKRLRELGLPPAFASQLGRELQRVADTGASGSVSGLHGLEPLSLTLTAVPDRDGVVQAVAVIADGGVVRLSRELAAARAEAEQARAEAAQARAEAEKARTAKGRFLSAASHDLRQPFQAMHLFHHLLMGRLTDKASIDLGRQLEQAIIGGETLLRALLEVSALEAGVVTPQPQTFPIDDTLGRMLQEFAPEAEAKGLRFNARPAEVGVTTDPVLLERLLRPILSNAVRYTEKGGVLLAARRRGKLLRIEVWDTGIGIAEANHAAIFEDFHQLGNPGRDRKQGLGLGLAIVRRLSQLLALPVTLRSQPGKGSVFAVDLPMAGPAGRDEDTEEENEPAVGAEESGTVLVIEDDAMQLEGIGLLLKGWGYSVIPTRSIGEACASLDRIRQAPDLVLSDLRLGGPETGIDAIREVRRRCGRRVPGVIVTGDTDPDRLRSVDRSGLRLVHKPCDPIALRSLLARTLTGGGRVGV